jgi:hypothetical protein
MGENSVIVSAKSPKHIDFNIDDYVVFRGENFYLANIPTEKKTGDRNTKGDVFQYDNMKFMSVQYELNNADFNDFVGGSQTDISFTAQPNFSFVAATVTDLAQRIQVNMDRYYTGDKKWTIKVDNNYTTSDDNLNKLITISNITCWGALALFKSLYDTNFIVRGRTVTIGGSGSIKDITFKVGAYKGLWDMTRNSQTDQGIVTKLTSYGNTTNIHPRYYSLIGVTVTAKLTAFDHIASSYSLFFLFDLNHTTELNDTVKFNISGSSTSYELQGTWGIYKDYTFGCRGMVESFAAYKVDTTSAIYEDVRAKVLSVGYANTSVTFVSGARKDNISDLSHLSFDVNSKLPNNMNIMNLMLPAFPTQTLAEWVEENKSKYSWLQEYVNQGYTFSTERFYPCIYSKNKDVLGIRPHTEYFTSEDETHKDIYPSLQYFQDDRNQVVGATTLNGGTISDSGVFVEGATVDPIYIIIPDLGFDFNDVVTSKNSFTLHFNSGYCGGRDFTCSAWTKDGTTWKLKCARIKDDSIGKYFPYVDAPIKKGDKFVITDIHMPDTYIEQASVELLKWSLKWLAKNDYSVFSYQLTPDINFIKRHDDKITDKGTTFYRTVKEGDILLIEDTDIGVTGSITIDQIKITIGDGLLPKYEITLRDTKTVGTVQKIQQQIDAIVSGGVSGGYNSTQVGEIAYSALKDKFLSKVSADTAAGLITFEPKDGSTVWTKQVSKGSNGTSGVTYWSSPSVLMIDAIKNGGNLCSSTYFSNTVKFYAQIGGVSLTAGTATLSGSAYMDSDMNANTDTVGQVTFSDDNGIIKEGTINVTVPFTDASGNSYTHDFPIEVKAVVSGKGISSVQVFYLATTVSSVSDYEAFKEETGWTETEQSVSEANPYLWTYQITTYSDGTKVATVPHIIGTYGHDGINGTNGYSLQLNPNQLVVDTADDGKVPDTALPLKCTIIVLKGGSQMATSVSITSNTNCTASASSNVISITAINEETVDGQTISCGSGYVDFTATDTTDNVALSGRVYFSVNVYKVASKIMKDNDSINLSVTLCQ